MEQATRFGAPLGTIKFREAIARLDKHLRAEKPRPVMTSTVLGGPPQDVWPPDFAIFTSHSDFVATVAFNSNGRALATGSDDMTCRVWDTASGQVLVVLKGHSKASKACFFMRQ